MKRKLLALVLGVLGLGGILVTSGATPASASGYASCTGTTNGQPNFFYGHAPYPQGNGIWGWATCVVGGTSVPPWDVAIPAGCSINEVDLEHYHGVTYPPYVVWGVVAENYEATRSGGPTWDTVIAAYVPPAGYNSYRTRFSTSCGWYASPQRGFNY